MEDICTYSIAEQYMLPFLSGGENALNLPGRRLCCKFLEEKNIPSFYLGGTNPLTRVFQNVRGKNP